MDELLPHAEMGVPCRQAVQRPGTTLTFALIDRCENENGRPAL